MSICRAKGFIDTAIQGGGRVLVHCNGAQSYHRSTLSTTALVGFKRPSYERAAFILIQPITVFNSIPVVRPQLIRLISPPLPLCFDTDSRRNIILSSVCDHVRHATLPDFVGGCSALCSESQVLHLSQQRFHHSDQGSSFNSSPCSSQGCSRPVECEVTPRFSD